MKKTIIYSIFVRNHTDQGSFRAIIPDLARIQAMGVDIIWLMPIHPIGKVKRKGSLGSPYSISDYGKVNPEFGTLEDFKALVEAIHDHGMKCMIDVVYNHTAHDSILRENHPEYFYRTPQGEFGNKIADWSDIIDLDFENQDLHDQLIEYLVYWTRQGVDGFRCDVASLVPVDFWIEARTAVEAVNPDTIWLAESVHAHFLQEVRDQGFYGAADAELYRAFDITYDYDIHHLFEGYFNGKNELKDYLQALKMQGVKNPMGARKLRFLENHDQPRAASLIPMVARRKNWLAFHWMLPGVPLICAGQEMGDNHRQTLFDSDPIDWTPNWPDGMDWFAKLAQVRLDSEEGVIHFIDTEQGGIAILTRELDTRVEVGIFNLEQRAGSVQLTTDYTGQVENVYTGQKIAITKGRVDLLEEPIRFFLAKALYNSTPVK
jgi:glycosidase